MTEKPTYYFVLPGVDVPCGGINVLIQFINVLNIAGYNVAPLYPAAHDQPPYISCDVQGYFSTDLNSAFKRGRSYRDRIKALINIPTALIKINLPIQRSASDVFIIPEFLYPEVHSVFSDAYTILGVQDVMGLARSLKRESQNGTAVIDDFDAVFITSEASDKAVKAFTNHLPHKLLLSVEKPNLTFHKHKKLQIAYMPRKREIEADIVVTLLKKLDVLKDIEFIKIDNFSNDDLIKTFNDSLLFLSFSLAEGFGLPAAEAMCAGCITVGYTGVGGDEYFTDDTGFPIADSDIVSFVNTVEAIILEYEYNPARLDKMREKSSNRLLNDYSIQNMRETLLHVWAEIDEVSKATLFAKEC
jgi:hypothetical protein